MTTTLAYDVEGRLTSATTQVGAQAAKTTTFAYDANGNRVLATYNPGASATKVYTPFPDYEVTDPPTGANVTRTTYRLGGQIAALRVNDGATNKLYYPLTDHLGNVMALSDVDGNFVSGSDARYDPFGAFTTTPATNPGMTDHGFTGHRHNNTGANNLGLIYMNARYYLPEVGRFVSPDSIVPEAGEPQSFNRYAYSYNNPTKYTDPSGHCNGDPSNSNPFDESGETIAYLDCTLENFDAMSIADRLLWIQYFMDQFHIGPWFNNIEGIIQGFVENGLADSGSWLSIVDAAILQAIQDGFVVSDMEGAQGAVGNATSENPGKATWKIFFDELAKDPAGDDDALIEMWGTAEAASTQHGEVIAGDLGLAPDPYETFFLKTGDAYRWAAFNGGLGIWAAAAALTVDANPFIAYRVGEWFNDPRSLDPIHGRSPVYWYSSAIWQVQP